MSNQKNFLTIDKYIIFLSERLGKGMFGEVFKASYISGQGRDGEYLAVKLIELSTYEDEIPNKISDELESVKIEIITLRSLKHPNIVRLHDVKRHKNKIFIFMEFCNQGDLKSFILKNDLSETEILYYFSQIINGFKHIHKKQIVHRDIKPENILMNNNFVKIADFGFAKKVNGGDTNMSFKGTPLTMSPQILEGSKYTSKTDIYSLGATLYFMFFKVFPHIVGNMIQLVKKLREDSPPNFTQNGVSISPEAQTLITRMLKYDESERIEWEELFQHPLLNLQGQVALEGVNILNRNDGTQEEGDEYCDLDFDFKAKPIKYMEPEKLEQEGQKLIDNWNNKLKMDQISFKFHRRITFDRGLAWFVRRVSKRFDDALKRKSNFCFEEVPFELQSIVRFLLSKFELLLVEKLKTSIENEENMVSVKEKDWELFVAMEEYKNIQKILTLDFKAIYFETFQHYNEFIKPLINGFLLQGDQEMHNLLKNSIFSYENFNDKEEFYHFFGKILLEFLSYFKPNLEKVKISEFGTYNRDQFKDLIFLIDDCLIMLGAENIFVWEEQKPINFNKLFQDRLQFFSDLEVFNIIKERVVLTYDYIIQN